MLRNCLKTLLCMLLVLMLPLCALFGAGFVCLCDTLARVVAAPYEIPVGIIMAFLGAPFFVFILIKGKGGQSNV